MIKLRERNLQVIKRVMENNEEVKALREALKRKHGIDPITDTEKFPVMKESFSWKKFQAKLQEADSSGAFVQFLRAGIQQIVNSMYMSVPTTYEDWVTVVPSSRAEELYAPNHGVAFPRQVGPSERYAEVASAALDLKLKNLKFGSMYAVEMELLEDDQTGTFQRQAAMLGEYMKLLAEVLCYGKLASASGMQYIDYRIPISETKPSNESTYPWSTGLSGGAKTRPSAFGTPTQANIQAGIIALTNQVNLQGIRMSVNPNRILAGPKYQFDLAVLANSAYYPSGAAAAGATGGAFAINPLKSLFDITISRHMFDNSGAIADSKAWYLVDDSKPWFILQMREGATVIQENPQAGASFELDQARFKARCRMNADHVDPRFAWQGSDGSV